jgi:uncharacterized repeat protein (TIGR03803 family)
MTNLSAWKMGGAVLLLCAATVVAAHAQTFTTLVSFDGTDGGGSFGGLIQGPDGNLYGTSIDGGANEDGAIFKVTPTGTLTTLYSFCPTRACTDGVTPYGGLALGTDGNFYGTTAGGGTNNEGTVFKITAAGTLTTLHSFSGADGTYPHATLLQSTDGSLYGTTAFGGNLNCYVASTDYLGCGTAFRITSGGTLTTLHSFAGAPTDGSIPNGGLVEGLDGKLYGTTSNGGTEQNGCFGYGCGSVFRITLSGRTTLLHSFDETDGIGPNDALLLASDGSFYGTTSGQDGNFFLGPGSVFAVTPTGSLTTLDSFDGANGSTPWDSLVLGTDGNLYGTTVYGGNGPCVGYPAPNGCGALFEATPAGTLTTLHNFEVTDGAYPYGGLFQATNGIFYGTTYAGGVNRGGTVFSLNMGLGPFVTFVRAAGKVGQTGGILGQGFTGTTSVSLNGIPASFTVVSDTYIRATVPAGATTGYATVTTPSSTLTSNVPFHVIP